MSPKDVISSPNEFIVVPYSPGFTVDFRAPAPTTNLQGFRQNLEFDAFERTDCPDELANIGGEILLALGIADDKADFALSLRNYSGENDFDAQLRICLRSLGVSASPKSRGHAVQLLLTRTGCLTREEHHPVRMYCHIPRQITQLESGATHFGYAADDGFVARETKREVPITKNTFFVIEGEAELEGDGRCVLFTHFEHRGITLYGGEVEPWGRLNYIDGCTDTLLLSPLQRGAPCLNALYFPAGIKQTQHTHPSIRCGMVIQGSGVCKTPAGDHPLECGDVFFLPPETYHSFHTFAGPEEPSKAALSVIAFHPDSDFGPTDEDHPMLNRTYFKFLHRLKSAERAQDATGLDATDLGRADHVDRHAPHSPRANPALGEHVVQLGNGM